MRTKKAFTLLLLLLSTLFIFAPLYPTYGSENNNISSAPLLNKGKKWRIGYIQGGDYGSYQKTLAAITTGLMRHGWIEETPLPQMPTLKDTAVLWHWLATQVKSDFLEFVEHARYDSEWDREKRALNKTELINRLNTKKDIDLILAMGTWAGQDLANNDHHVPTVIGSTTDPIASKIIKSVEDSGYDHIIAKVDPDRHKRQVRLFHRIFNFKSLGIVYENSPEGRGFSGVDSVYEVAGQLHFEVKKCEAAFTDMEREQVKQDVVNCYKKLADEVEAVYIVRHPGINLKLLKKILPPLIEHKIPTFAQGLSDEVQHGVLLSISLADFSYLGDFYATTIARILNGAKPRQLKQLFQNPPKIAINLKTAQLIGYNPSVDIVGAADEIYTTIEE